MSTLDSASGSARLDAPANNLLVEICHGVQSTTAFRQATILVVIAVALFPFAGNSEGDARLLVPFLVSAPLFLGLFIGLVAHTSQRQYLVMPRLTSFAIWSLLVGGVLAGPYASLTLTILGLIICAVSTAIISAVLLVTVSYSDGGSFGAGFSSAAAFVSSVFIFFASATTVAGLFLAYVDLHYAGRTAFYLNRLVGRPEVFLLALPALALATTLISRVARKPMSTVALSLPLVLFGLAGLTGYMTTEASPLSPRYLGTPFVFPTVLLVLFWALSLLRGINKSEYLPLASVALGSSLVVLALLNKGPGESMWTVGRIDASIVGFALVIAFGGLVAWISDSLKVEFPFALSAGCLLLLGVGGTLAISYAGIAVHLVGDYYAVKLISVGRTGEFLLALGIGFSAALALWVAYSRPNKGQLS